VAYRNKTFVSFASEDIRAYWLMCAWRANKKIAFNFLDAHDLNTALDTSQPETIRRRLRERLANTKQVVLLIGDGTRATAARRSRFLYYEVEVIRRLGLPVVFANLNGSRRSQKVRMPSLLADQYTMSVSFQPTIIKFALDDFVDGYMARKQTNSGPYYYGPNIYARLGL
jgi:Thoeris protein ThsB, TIR-like domain